MRLKRRLLKLLGIRRPGLEVTVAALASVASDIARGPIPAPPNRLVDQLPCQLSCCRSQRPCMPGCLLCSGSLDLDVTSNPSEPQKGCE